jgi:hypothetical protein
LYQNCASLQQKNSKKFKKNLKKMNEKVQSTGSQSKTARPIRHPSSIRITSDSDSQQGAAAAASRKLLATFPNVLLCIYSSYYPPLPPVHSSCCRYLLLSKHPLAQHQPPQPMSASPPAKSQSSRHARLFTDDVSQPDIGVSQPDIGVSQPDIGLATCIACTSPSNQHHHALPLPSSPMI